MCVSKEDRLSVYVYVDQLSGTGGTGATLAEGYTVWLHLSD